MYTTLVLAFLFPALAFGAGKKPSHPYFLGKKVVGLSPVENIQIEMPNQEIHNFGEDYQASLVTNLIQTGRYIVADALPRVQRTQRILERYAWSGSVTPAANVTVEVDALNFSTGSRGEQSFYGFDERFRNIFNDGKGEQKNEFPLRGNFVYPSWFGDTFQQKGVSPFDSLSGLDLGDGFNLDFLFAWLHVKYARYHSELHLKLKLDTLSEFSNSFRWIKVSGDGFFFDVAGAYQNFSAGIALARKDAMSQAFKKAISGSVDAIDRALQELPLLARVDAVLQDGTVLLGTGPYSEVQPGVIYECVDDPRIQIQVSASVASGSIAKFISGRPSSVNDGKLFKQLLEAPVRAVARNSGVPDAVESIALNKENFPPSSLTSLVPEISRALAFLRSIAEVIFLPYRIWRYFMYDQSYHRVADRGGVDLFDINQSSWAKQMGLHLAPEMENDHPVVAVLDSGVDYNHPSLHDSLWLNPFPALDENSRQDRYGWDFISNDSRPFDDHYHGTQVASLVSMVAPKAKIMPVKIFNPWGITTSAAIYGGFLYAVDHGAQIILCSWSTFIQSEAIRKGIGYAKDHGVVVVASAGDQGLNLNRWKVYPASFAPEFSNLLVVTGVDSNYHLFDRKYRKANYGSTIVRLAAPGDEIQVAEPRRRKAKESSSGLAAAIVAGVLARNLTSSSGNYLDWINELVLKSQPISQLEGFIQGGNFVQVQK